MNYKFKRTIATFVALSLFCLFQPLTTKIPQANAARADIFKDFKAENIINDENFYSNSTLTTAKIQELLDNQGKNCTSNKSKNLICLKDYKENTPDKDESKGVDDETGSAYTRCKKYTGGENKSAANIISTISKLCNISEKVLIVTMQKEQSLLTTSNPTYVNPGGVHASVIDSKTGSTKTQGDGWAYRAAFGFGCPDSGVVINGIKYDCDPNYAGFFNQLYAAAKQFQVYKHTISFSFYKGRTSKIAYAPGNCTKKSVKVSNFATAGLYNYTPYTPNESVLSTVGVASGSCNAYGNRNFYYYYKTWFGDPLTSAKTATKIDITKLTFSKISDKEYNSKLQTPLPKITYSGKELKLGTDFSASYKSNKNVGTVTLFIKGKGNYQNTKTIKFKIIPAIKYFSITRSKLSGRTFSIWVKKISKETKAKAGTPTKVTMYYSSDNKNFRSINADLKTLYRLTGLQKGDKEYIYFKIYKVIGSTKYYSKKTKTISTPKVK